MTAREFRRDWVQIDGTPALPLPGGRFAAPMIAPGPLCPCESGRDYCYWAAIYDGDPVEGGLGFWVDLAQNEWHHDSEQSARHAIEREFGGEFDLGDIRKAEADAA